MQGETKWGATATTTAAAGHSSSAVIVQARMTSKRFPGKVMAPLLGKPVLEHVLARALMIPNGGKVACAFPEDEASAPILDLCRKMRVIAFAGDEHDVLDRYYEAAKSMGSPKIIMRITADCPLIDPMICGAILDIAKREKLDYASNVHPHRTYPKGLDCEVFTFDCLEAACCSTDESYDREHVTPWMQRTRGLHRGTLQSKNDMSHHNYCVDYPGDIHRIEKIIKETLCDL